MQNDPTSESCIFSIADVLRALRPIEDRERADRAGGATGTFSYRMKLGRATIQLDSIEYRILCFLAAKPYRAFTRRRIAEAVSFEGHPVAEETVDRHIASLREKLGFFSDYIQSVPYIGYRFKA